MDGSMLIETICWHVFYLLSLFFGRSTQGRSDSFQFRYLYYYIDVTFNLPTVIACNEQEKTSLLATHPALLSRNLIGTR